MLTQEQIANRKIGSSDAATIMGENPWSTPRQLWMEKRGEFTREFDSDRTEFGSWMEHKLAEYYREKTGRRVWRDVRTLAHPSYDYMTCHVDRFVKGGGLEIKVVRDFLLKHWENPETGEPEVPRYVQWQCQHAMFVTRRMHWDVIALLGGAKPFIARVPVMQNEQVLLQVHCAAFWRDLQAGVMPAPVNLDDVRLRYPVPQRKVGTVRAGPEERELAIRYASLGAQIRDLTKAQKAIKVDLSEAFGDKNTMTVDGEVIATQNVDSRGTSRFLVKVRP